MEEKLTLFGNSQTLGIALSQTCNADVGIFANLFSGVFNTNNLNVSGTATIKDLTVTGTSLLNSLNVSALATIKDLTVTGTSLLNSLDVSATATIRNVTVTGTLTSTNLTTSSTNGITVSSTSTGPITLSTGNTTSDMISLYGPASNAFFLRFGQVTGQSNPVRLFQANTTNDGVTGSVSGDVGLQFNASTQSFFVGTASTLLYQFSSSGLRYPTGFGSLNDVYRMQSGTFPFLSSAPLPLNMLVRFARIGDTVFVQFNPATITTGSPGTVSFTFVNVVQFPAAFRPATDTTCTIIVAIAGNQCVGIMKFFTVGTIRFQPLAQATVAGVTSTFEGSFPNTTACGILTTQNVSYLIN